MQHLATEINRASRTGGALSIVMIDLDNFKALNDTLGHPLGDVALQKAATIMRSVCRQTDFLGRYGGDEFLILLPSTNLAGACRVAERIREAVMEARLSEIGGPPVNLLLSFGLASYPEDAVNQQELIAVADLNLYEAKHRGGNLVGTSETRVESATLAGLENFGTLDALVAAVDAKDRYTRRHSEEVAIYAHAIGEALELPQETLEDLQIASIAHKVGLIAVPDWILRKNGPLTPEEFEVIRQHPSIGAKIASTIPALARALPGVRHHHERWDGRGYPDGLRGAKIPLLGRIIAIADAYSAMIHTRPYRDSLTPSEALGEIQRGAGTQFDPEIATVFLRLMEKRGVTPAPVPTHLPEVVSLRSQAM
ncbi:MAG: diguanylate cyclase [Armatimonadetes bacterium]|nr:diguanylate cyclase [Armatimonadota bacterium]